MSKSSAPIGMFDSGLGGLSVWKVLDSFLPEESFLYYGDSSYAPYGNRSNDQIRKRSYCITEKLLEHGAKMIVVACNTATAAAIENLRKSFPEIPFVGMEPAIKPASLMTKTGNIGVLATQGTLNGNLFRKNQDKYGPYVTIHYREGAGLVELAENNMIKSEKARKLLTEYIRPMLQANVDQLVLGCTHYPLFIPLIREITDDNINIIDPADAIARRTKDLLISHRMMNTADGRTKPGFFTSGQPDTMMRMLQSIDPHLTDFRIETFNCR
jgi:glutamate racemase